MGRRLSPADGPKSTSTKRANSDTRSVCNRPQMNKTRVKQQGKGKMGLLDTRLGSKPSDLSFQGKDEGAMSQDRYQRIAKSLRYMGWFQDFTLRRARLHVIQMLRSSEAVSVLDACCGAGTLTRYISQAGMRVTGVDSSPSMLELARRKAPDARFIEGDVSRVGLGEQFDGSVIALSLHEMSEESRGLVWQSIMKVTRPGGIAVVMDYVSPTSIGPAARVAEWCIWKDEKSIEKEDPGHYRNFREFMSRGGAKNWLLDQSQSILEEKIFLFGNLGVFAVAA